LVESQKFGIPPVGEQVLANNDAEVTRSEAFARFGKAGGKDGGNATEEQSFTERPANLIIGADNKVNWFLPRGTREGNDS
jgi:hypothetical protein